MIEIEAQYAGVATLKAPCAIARPNHNLSVQWKNGMDVIGPFGPPFNIVHPV